MKAAVWILISIFILTLSVRLYIASSTPYFSTGEAYFQLRQVEHIKSTGFPLYHDALSYGGRTYVFLPLFQYVLAFFSLFMPLAAKIIPNLLASSMVIIAFLITRKLANASAALVTALAAGFVPIFFSTVNTISPYTLAVPLFFLCLYSIMLMPHRMAVPLFLVSFFALVLTSAIVSILALSLLFYLLLIRLEGLEENRKETELIIFTTFFTAWASFLLYKKVFLVNGLYFFFGNMPSALLDRFFAELGIFDILTRIGIVPFLFGLYVIYLYAFREKNRNLYLLIAFALVSFALLWLKMIPVQLGLIFFGTVLVLLFGQGIALLMDFMQKTRFAKALALILVLVIALLFLTSAWPSISLAKAQQSYTQQEILAFAWLNTNTLKDSVVMSSPEDGFLVSSIGNRTNVMDGNFLNIPSINQRYADLTTLYNTLSLTEAISIMSKYQARYLLLSPQAKKHFSIDQLRFVDDECFKLVYDSQTLIYELRCVVQT